MPSKLLKQPPNRLQRKFRQQQNLQLLNRLQIFQQRQSLLRLSLQQPSRPSPKHRKMMAIVTQTVAEDAILTAFQLKFPRIIHMRLMVIRLLFMNRIITNILKQARTDFYSLLTGHMTERSA